MSCAKLSYGICFLLLCISLFTWKTVDESINLTEETARQRATGPQNTTLTVFSECVQQKISQKNIVVAQSLTILHLDPID